MDTRVILSRDVVERRATARGVGGRGRPPLHLSVYQHVLAWQEALDSEGIELSMWRIHRKIDRVAAVSAIGSLLGALGAG